MSNKAPLLLLLISACVPQDSGDPGVNKTDRDIKHYVEVARELEENREDFMGEAADEVKAVENRVFWLQFPQFAPDLYSYVEGEETPLRYEFSIGGDAYNYAASEQLVVTAEEDGKDLIYRAYAVTESNTLLGELVLDGPTDEQRWWSYAADGGNVYIAVTGDETTILKWVPGSPATELVVLEELGLEVGILWDLFAYRGRLIVIESGRLWLVDPSARTATWMENEQEVQNGSINKNGMVYPAEGGPRYVSFSGGPPIHIGEMIEESGYELNETFASAHEYLSNPVLYEDLIIYVAQSGIFSLDMESGEVAPLLLEPRDSESRLVYRDPTITEDGTLYIQGLESESGAIGADGPVFKLQLQ